MSARAEPAGAATIARRAAAAPLSAQDVTWRAYYDHSHGCAECHRRLLNCETGAALWEAYRAARGPILHPMPGRC
ncbi:hypothetical protein [Actinacidiphila rubida]|uniref:Uncharacterized protein n=1 Tax=Actinacidiphila rubida TaxID=310780 RepID=A0A1H8SZ01_9ACTN|nr:hypothetical protein [Actinacidiphila rubida]SEO84149.1 hypothetical protein SAMN05216267_104689 [Actinacidiphila rubida]